MSPIIRLLRPLQWLKNGFVFTPLIFSKHLFEQPYYVPAVTAFLVFCFASSVVYIVNDILDKESDKLHPQKKKRPIASGEVSIVQAAVIALVVALAAIAGAWTLPFLFKMAVLTFVAIQMLYSFLLKHIVIVDIFSIALGFMLRVFAGAFAIDVEISHWIVITTLFLSLFLATSKRRSELLMVTKQGIDTKRKVLRQYTIPFLDALLIITTTGMAISYALYTMADRTREVFQSDSIIFTTVFVVFGIFRYLFLVFVREEGENPTAILTSDAPTGVNLLLWLATCVALMYFS